MLLYDPFAGTGGMLLSGAEMGAVVFGSDADGRTLRGDGPDKCIKHNFKHYQLSPNNNNNNQHEHVG